MKSDTKSMKANFAQAVPSEDLPPARAKKERPILFSAPMVRALLAGTKTQTRRVVKWRDVMPGLNLGFTGLQAVNQDARGWVLTSMGGSCWQERCAPTHCPYGQPGDRLWVRENGWQRPERTPKMMREGADTWEPYYFDADGISDQEAADFKAWGFKRRPSIHMPRAASRILLEVTEVRVQRLQDISEADAIAEGIEPIGYTGRNPGPNRYSLRDQHGSANFPTAAEAYQHLWHTINGAGSWNANPWVWTVSFKSIKP